MSFTATRRYQLREAPGTLGLVQDLLNTRQIQTYGDDLLATHTAAQGWASAAVATWATTKGVPVPALELSLADPRHLRDTRDALDGLLAGTEVPVLPSTAAFEITPDRVALVPTGTGARWLASAVWCEVLLAQQAGTWPRLKSCKNPVCGSIFYDGSRNNSGAWHDAKTCGNVANLRASRERKRQLGA